MTSRPQQNLRERRRRGFTLVEILVAIGIMVLLIGILIPVAGTARRRAKESRAAGDLQAIATGLTAYQADFGAYPAVSSVNPAPDPSSNGYFGTTGAHILCRAMFGPGPNVPLNNGDEPTAGHDGNDGPGFRVRPGGRGPNNNWEGGGGDDVKATGRVYGPYLVADKFVIDDDDDRANTVIAGRAVIRTSDGWPILYFPPAATRPNLTANQGYCSSRTVSPPPPTAPRPLYQANDNLRYFLDDPLVPGAVPPAQLQIALERLRLMIGDNNGYAGTAPFGDGNITPGTETAVTAPFLLWSSGPDGKFGPVTNPPDKAAVDACDDVTNFGQ